MAKKSRRARKGKRRRPPVAAPVAAPKPMAPVPRPLVRQKTAALPEKRLHTNFAEQYSYVRQDIRRIALLASSIFAVLIILSFVLR